MSMQCFLVVTTTASCFSFTMHWSLHHNSLSSLDATLLCYLTSTFYVMIPKITFLVLLRVDPLTSTSTLVVVTPIVVWTLFAHAGVRETSPLLLHPMGYAPFVSATWT